MSDIRNTIMLALVLLTAAAEVFGCKEKEDFYLQDFLSFFGLEVDSCIEDMTYYEELIVRDWLKSSNRDELVEKVQISSEGREVQPSLDFSKKGALLTFVYGEGDHFRTITLTVFIGNTGKFDKVNIGRGFIVGENPFIP